MATSEPTPAQPKAEEQQVSAGKGGNLGAIHGVPAWRQGSGLSHPLTGLESHGSTPKPPPGCWEHAAHPIPCEIWGSLSTTLTLSPSGPQSIGTRVANLPLVSSAYDMVSSAYTCTKESHPYVRSVCDAAERGVKTLTAAAASGAQPLLTRLEPQSECGAGQHPAGRGSPETGSHRGAIVRQQERNDLVSHLQFVSPRNKGLEKLEGNHLASFGVPQTLALAELLQGSRVLNPPVFYISSFHRQQIRLQRAGQAGGEAAHPAAAPREGGGRDQGAGVGHGERGGGEDALGAGGRGGHPRGAAAGHGRGHRAGQIGAAAGSVPPRDRPGAGAQHRMAQPTEVTTGTEETRGMELTRGTEETRGMELTRGTEVATGTEETRSTEVAGGTEVATGSEAAAQEQQRRWQSYFVRVGSLSARLPHRALRRSLGDLQRARLRAQRLLAQLHHVIRLIEAGQRGADGPWHSAREHLHGLWLEWSQQDEVPMEDSEVEARTLAMLQGLLQQLHTACSHLAAGARAFPSSVQETAGHVRHGVEGVQASLASARSFQELSGLVLAQSRDAVTRAQLSLEGLLEHVGQHTPLPWLVGPFAPALVEYPEDVPVDMAKWEGCVTVGGTHRVPAAPQVCSQH
uniref:Uncharacterized protein n=1 Tax=Ficedula albicollis TaxID=59894 RepID=A0A803W5I7_FICAL